jgi:hypothetical protein
MTLAVYQPAGNQQEELPDLLVESPAKLQGVSPFSVVLYDRELADDGLFRAARKNWLKSHSSQW